MDGPPRLPVRPGETIAGKYRVERVLGQGGMGVVLAATHLKLGKPRAIKLIRSEIAANADASRRFLREAQAACDLRSEHVARVLDVDQLPTGEPYMVMEYLDGADLACVLAEEGPLPAGEAVRYVRQACEALSEAHTAGVVHRDIKPANLFLTRGADQTPAIKVLDFGIAKATSPTTDSVGQSGSSAFLGTMRYSAPEQILAARDVDARVDLWALGVVLYELTSGKPPFQSESMLQLLALITEAAPLPLSEAAPDVPEGLSAVVMRCLEKDRDRRPASAAELRELLAPFESPADEASIQRLSRDWAPRGAAARTANTVTAAREPAGADSPPPEEPTATVASERDRPSGATLASGQARASESTLASGDERASISTIGPVSEESVPGLPRRRGALFVGLGVAAVIGVIAVVLAMTQGHSSTAAASTVPSGSEKAPPSASVVVAPAKAPASVVVAPAAPSADSRVAPPPIASNSQAAQGSAPSSEKGGTRLSPSATAPGAEPPKAIAASPPKSSAPAENAGNAATDTPSPTPPAAPPTQAPKPVTYDADGNPIP